MHTLVYNKYYKQIQNAVVIYNTLKKGGIQYREYNIFWFYFKENRRKKMVEKIHVYVNMAWSLI